MRDGENSGMGILVVGLLIVVIALLSWCTVFVRTVAVKAPSWTLMRNVMHWTDIREPTPTVYVKYLPHGVFLGVKISSYVFFVFSVGMLRLSAWDFVKLNWPHRRFAENHRKRCTGYCSASKCIKKKAMTKPVLQVPRRSVQHLHPTERKTRLTTSTIREQASWRTSGYERLVM